MFVILWRYQVREGSEGAFAAAYGPRGDWAALFGRAEGYLGTELLADEADPAFFVTLDRWASPEAFGSFQTRFGDDYAALDTQFEALTVAETRIGTFTSVD